MNTAASTRPGRTDLKTLDATRLREIIQVSHEMNLRCLRWGDLSIDFSDTRIPDVERVSQRVAQIVLAQLRTHEQDVGHARPVDDTEAPRGAQDDEEGNDPFLSSGLKPSQEHANPA